ncbi:MAG: ArsR/SmtB family transcription factor [Candidatus Roseilinea sp.]|uniref:ArsR/SmtB family transcription factor n=1 Tax=Candidatus Roseilinea sp. TaxID=2838777 RepID=UPI00404981FA
MREDDQLSRLFKALMHPARLQILDLLRDGEQCVCHMEAHLGYRQAYISQHLAVLREAGLIEDRRDGWNVYYRVAERGVYEVVDRARAIAGVRVPKRAGRRARVACACPKCNTKGVSASSNVISLERVVVA